MRKVRRRKKCTACIESLSHTGSIAARVMSLKGRTILAGNLRNASKPKTMFFFFPEWMPLYASLQVMPGAVKLKRCSFQQCNEHLGEKCVAIVKSTRTYKVGEGRLVSLRRGLGKCWKRNEKPIRVCQRTEGL